MKLVPPRKIITTGNEDEAWKLVSVGDSLLASVENDMKYRGIKIKSSLFRLGGGAVIRCVVNYNIRQIHIYVPTGGSEVIEEGDIQCFANTGIALGMVFSIVDMEGVDLTQIPIPSHTNDPLSGIEIELNGYPDNYYCTKLIRYGVTVCAGDKYIIFNGVASSDFALHKPGDKVLVMMTRIKDIPTAVIDDNNSTPCSKPVFTKKVKPYGSDTILITPFATELKKYEII